MLPGRAAPGIERRRGRPARTNPAALRQTGPMTQPDPVMLRATDLGRRFGSLWAIRGVDLEVYRGEVLGLLGPNGAGKTTTVRLLTALIEPSEGRATVDGLDVVERPDDVRARVGILTETPGLYDKLSATANLEFFGRLYGLDAATRAERIEHYLRLFSLWERRDDVAGTFSKGMKQKLAIARALLHDPAVVFLDEPTAALDPEAAYIVREAIEALRRLGRTIVLATHNLDEADRLCDRVAFIRGALLRVDSPAGLRGSLGGHGVEVGLGGAVSGASGDAASEGDRRGDRGCPCGAGRHGRVGQRHATPDHDRGSGGRHSRDRACPGRGRCRRPRGPRARHLTRAGLLRRHGRPARPGRGGLMRGWMVGTVLRREWSETVRNRLLMSTILLPPVILTIAPLALAGVVGDRALPQALLDQVLAQRPEWASFTPSELAGAFAVQQFLVFFLLMPAYIPLSIATFSIIGEKQARTLEPVLATPIRTGELLAGKAIAALVPGVVAGWVTYVVFVVLASVVYGPNLFGVVTDGSWLAGVFALGSGRRAVVRGGRGDREFAGQRPTGGPAGRWHRDRADHRDDPPPGDRHGPRRRVRVSAARRDRAGDQRRRAADRRRAVRS